jgi:hypothetical protein
MLSQRRKLAPNPLLALQSVVTTVAVPTAMLKSKSRLDSSSKVSSEKTLKKVSSLSRKDVPETLRELVCFGFQFINLY